MTVTPTRYDDTYTKSTVFEVGKGQTAMRIAICETQVSYLNYIIRLLKQIRELELSTITSYIDPDWILSDLNARAEVFDIAIVNKDFGNHQGIYVAQIIAEKCTNCQIILVSEANVLFPEYYEVNSVCLLPKEYLPNHLVTVIQKAYRNLEKLDNSLLQVASNNEKILIPLEDIQYIERVLRKTHIVLKNEVIETYQTPEQLMDNAMALSFVRCHRSIYVNIKKIYKLRANELVLRDNVSIPIGRAFSPVVRSKFQNFANKI